MGQDFKKDTKGKASFCFMMSGTSAGRCKTSGAHQLQVGVIWRHHKSCVCSCYCLPTGMRAPLCGLSRGLGFLIAWWCLSKWRFCMEVQHSKATVPENKTKEKVEAGSPFVTLLWIHIAFLYSVGDKQVTPHPYFRGRNVDPTFCGKTAQVGWKIFKWHTCKRSKNEEIKVQGDWKTWFKVTKLLWENGFSPRVRISKPACKVNIAHSQNYLGSPLKLSVKYKMCSFP